MAIKNLLGIFTAYLGRLLTAVTPFSVKKKKRPLISKKRPPISRHAQYTRDVLKDERLEIGEHTYGTPKVVGIFRGQQQKLKIGRFCSIAEGVTIILEGTHRMDLVSTYPFIVFPDEWPEAISLKIPKAVGSPIKGDVVIGNDVWIGWEAMILPEVRIGDGAVIGTRSVVTRDVEPYSIVAGNPARLIGKRFDDETIRKLLEIEWWNWPPEKINENLDVICGNDISRMF